MIRLALLVGILFQSNSVFSYGDFRPFSCGLDRRHFSAPELTLYSGYARLFKNEKGKLTADVILPGYIEIPSLQKRILVTHENIKKFTTTKPLNDHGVLLNTHELGNECKSDQGESIASIEGYSIDTKLNYQSIGNIFLLYEVTMSSGKKYRMAYFGADIFFGYCDRPTACLIP